MLHTLNPLEMIRKSIPRIDAPRAADRIMILDKGDVAEFDTPQNLLRVRRLFDFFLEISMGQTKAEPQIRILRHLFAQCQQDSDGMFFSLVDEASKHGTVD